MQAKVGKINWKEIMIEPFELAEECMKINYYGPKRMSEVLVPLLRLSDSPRIVNVSSSMGRLQVQKLDINPQTKIKWWHPSHMFNQVWNCNLT